MAKKPNLRIYTHIDDDFQIQSGENTVIENSTIKTFNTEDDPNTLTNYAYGSTYEPSKEDSKNEKNCQVLIEDQLN